MNATQMLAMKASNAGMNPAQAADFIKSCDQFRTFREKMARYADEGELRAKLMAGLALCHPEAKADSLDRKVRMWLGGQTDLMLDRATIIELAFILELDVEKADAFLALMTDEGFRWRDPDEIIMIFALGQGLKYPEALHLRASIGTVLATADASPQEENLTGLVREEVLRIATQDELRAYLQNNADRFGKCRSRAWQLFMTYMERLKSPAIDGGVQMLIDEKEMQSDAPMKTLSVLRAYLHREMIPQGDRRSQIMKDKRMSKGQKAALSSVLSAWPDEGTLLKMEKRQLTVSRKVLMLLFLALDEDDEQDEEDWWDMDEDEAASARVESRCSRMNLMLGSCGFRLIDPRNPFDWVILYTVSVEDLFDSDQQLDALLSELFGGNES